MAFCFFLTLLFPGSLSPSRVLLDSICQHAGIWTWVAVTPARCATYCTYILYILHTRASLELHTSMFFCYCTNVNISSPLYFVLDIGFAQCRDRFRVLRCSIRACNLILSLTPHNPLVPSHSPPPEKNSQLFKLWKLAHQHWQYR